MSRQSAVDNYTVQVRPVPGELGGGYEALFPQLARGVVGYGSTQQEAVADLLQAVPDFLEAIDQMGQALPAAENPRGWEEFSGKFNVRVPKVLHAKLVRLAEGQGVSLNALVQAVLTSGATALEAGHAFGAVVEPAGAPVATPASADRDRLRLRRAAPTRETTNRSVDKPAPAS